MSPQDDTARTRLHDDDGVFLLTANIALGDRLTKKMVFSGERKLRGNVQRWE